MPSIAFFSTAHPCTARPPRFFEAPYGVATYSLASIAGLFCARHGQLWQLVLGKQQRNGIYRPVG